MFCSLSISQRIFYPILNHFHIQQRIKGTALSHLFTSTVLFPLRKKWICVKATWFLTYSQVIYFLRKNGADSKGWSMAVCSCKLLQQCPEQHLSHQLWCPCPQQRAPQRVFLGCRRPWHRGDRECTCCSCPSAGQRAGAAEPQWDTAGIAVQHLWPEMLQAWEEHWLLAFQQERVYQAWTLPKNLKGVSELCGNLSIIVKMTTWDVKTHLTSEYKIFDLIHVWLLAVKLLPCHKRWGSTENIHKLDPCPLK